MSRRGRRDYPGAKDYAGNCKKCEQVFSGAKREVVLRICRLCRAEAMTKEIPDAEIDAEIDALKVELADAVAFSADWALRHIKQVAEITKLREALEVYGDPCNWTGNEFANWPGNKPWECANRALPNEDETTG